MSIRAMQSSWAAPLLFILCGSSLAQVTMTEVRVTGPVSELPAITSDAAAQYGARMSQSRLVWTDERNGNPDIYLYDVATGQERRITTNTADQFGADIAGDRIVWVDHRNGNFDLFVYNLVTNVEFPLVDNIFDQINLAIYGDRVVWTDYRNGDPDIYMYDIAAGTETQIALGVANQDLADVSDRYVVWQDNRNGNFDIFLFDMVTGTERQLTSNAADQIAPAVDGNRVAWMDQRNGNWDIYVYDLSTNTEIAVTSDAADQSAPMLHGNLLVWPDSRNGNYDIYMYDFSTNQETQVTKNGESQLGGRIYGDYLAWSDFRNGNWDIYMAKLGARQAAPDFYANRVVWHDDRNGNWDIYSYDLATDTETPVTIKAGNQGWPRIYGDKVIWLDIDAPDHGLYMYDLASGIEVQLTNGSTASYPEIHGDYIVWMDNRHSGNPVLGELYTYHIPSGIQTRGPATIHATRRLSMFGNRIVWHGKDELTSGEYHVYAFDLVTGFLRRLTTADGVSSEYPRIYGNRVAWLSDNGTFYDAVETFDLIGGGAPSRIPTDVTNPKWAVEISGDRVIWQESRNGNYGFYLYDLATRAESQLLSQSAFIALSDFFGNRLVWRDHRNGDADIYLGDLIVPLPPIDRIGVISTNIESIPIGDFAAPSSKQSAGTFQTFSGTSDSGDKVRENRKNSLLNRLQAVTMELQVAETTTDSATRNSAYQSAVDQLRSMLEKTDGFAERGSADVKGSGFTPDWIITASSQGLVDPLIRDLIFSLETLIVPSQ